MKKRKFQLSEKQLGYTFVLPSLLMVFIVILWPVAQSFWNSMFDYRLNDPTRSQKMLHANIDLETYLDNQYYLDNQLGQLAEDVPDTEQQTILDMESNIQDYHDTLLEDNELKEKADEINTLLTKYQPVRNKELKYHPLDDSFAEDFRNTLTSSSEKLSDLAEATENKELQTSLTQSSELIESTSQSILASNFIGTKNYKKYLKDKRMWISLWNTSIFTIISVFFELIFGMLIALLINRAFIGRGLIRASVLIPWAVPTAVAAMMWGFLYDGQSGIIAHYLDILHIIPGASWLLSTGNGGLFSVILADVWKTTPYMALLLLAGLQTVPQNLYEASNVDGANKLQQFFKITLPLLKSSILVALLFRTLDAFRVFDLIYVLTGGGPANSTESISVYAYKVLFAQQKFGEGSTLSVIVFLCVALISFIYVKLIGSDLFEGRTK